MENQIIYINNIKTNYIIYTNGKIYSMISKKFLKPRQTNEKDYLYVSLYVNGKIYEKYVHRLVATSFIANPVNKPEVNHKDGNKTNNDVSNLEWVTTSENIIHAFKTGLKHANRGSKSHFAKYDNDEIKYVCKLLSEGLLTINEISHITNVPFSTIYGIINKENWVCISNEYNINNYYHDRNSYTHDMYESCFKLLEENKKPLYEISDISKIRYSSINNIRRHVKNPFYNDLFDKYMIDNYESSKKVYKSIPSELYDEALLLLQDGMSIKYAKRILSNKYNINEEAIRVFIRDNI